MVGLKSSDTPWKLHVLENLEEDNDDFIVMVESDEEHSDEGNEGYEPLSDVLSDDDNCNVDEAAAAAAPAAAAPAAGSDNYGEFTDASASDSDTGDRLWPAELSRSIGDIYCKCPSCQGDPLSSTKKNVNEAEGASGSSAEINKQLTNPSTSDADTKDRLWPVEHSRSVIDKYCKCPFCRGDPLYGRKSGDPLPGPKKNVNEAEGASGSSAEIKQESSNDGTSNSRLEMGEQQMADVMAAMANVTLPASAVPQWATVVPEDQWIQHILERVKVLQDKKNE